MTLPNVPEIGTAGQATGVTPEDLQKKVADLEKHIHELNEENAARRTKLKEYEDAEATRKLASLSEIEKARLETAEHKSKVERLQGELAKRDLDAAVSAEAERLGFKSAAYALKLADLSGVTKDDKGNYAGVKEALEALLVQDPDLAKKNFANVPGTPHVDDGRRAASEKLQQAKARYRAPRL